MAERASKSHRGLAVALGVAATVAVLIGHFAGLGDRLEGVALDARFNRAWTAPDTGRVVHIDIDDRSLERVGRWPWSREIFGRVIGVLHEAGAENVSLDIILPDPEEIRFVDETASLYNPTQAELALNVPATPILDDLILTRILRTAGRTFLPLHIQVAGDAESFAARTDSDDPLVLRILPLLRKDRLLSFDQVSDGLGKLPEGTARDDVARAYLRARGLLEMERFSLDLDRAEGLDLPHGFLIPPLVPFAEADAGSGYVTFRPDPDGIVRHMPLMFRCGERIYPHFALSIAADALARDHDTTYELSADPDALTVSFADGTKRVIPLDDRGRMILTWLPVSWRTTRLQDPHWHVPIRRPADIVLQRKRIERNQRLARQYLWRMTGKGRRSPELAALYRKADEIYQAQVAYDRQRYRAMLFDPGHIPPEKDFAKAEADVERQIDTAAKTFLEELELIYLAEPPTDPADRKEYDRLRWLRDELTRIDKENAQIRKDVAAQLAELRELVRGKICLIGSISTGAADFIPTCLSERTPGVVVHSNLIEAVLTGQFISPAPLWATVLAILLAGAAASLIAAARPVVTAAVLNCLLAAAYLVFNVFVVFGQWHIWLVAVAPVAAIAAAFLVITAFRQITEERAKRRIRGMFAHALSGPLVDVLIQDPTLMQARNRPITCMFMDLAGFTSLSGRLGPERTVELLHRYFDVVTDVLQDRWGGYINKFLGDGVFAIFGAPVEQPDHPLRAIQCSIDYQKCVIELNRQLAGEFGGSDIAVRIGVTTDEGMFGDCGSTNRADYTAIGEVVNLASRLEASNKFFHTDICASASSWMYSLDEGLVARPLGRGIISGIREPVELYNVLGREAELSDGDRRFADDFTAAQAALAEQRFQDAHDAFAAALALRPDDPAGLYLRDCCRAVLDDPLAVDRPTPTINKSGVIRLVWPWETIESDEFETPK